MSSVLNLSGLNYNGRNSLGNKIRAMESEIAEMRKTIAQLKSGVGVASATPQVIQGPPGPAGPAGPAGPTGPTGPAGPMAYIAMPPQFAAAATPAPVAAPTPAAAAAPTPAAAPTETS
jgi:hypothetical protein